MHAGLLLVAGASGMRAAPLSLMLPGVEELIHVEQSLCEKSAAEIGEFAAELCQRSPRYVQEFGSEACVMDLLDTIQANGLCLENPSDNEFLGDLPCAAVHTPAEAAEALRAAYRALRHASSTAQAELGEGHVARHAHLEHWHANATYRLTWSKRFVLGMLPSARVDEHALATSARVLAALAQYMVQPHAEAGAAEWASSLAELVLSFRP